MIGERRGDFLLFYFERLAQEPQFVHALAAGKANFAPHRGLGREQAVHWRGEVCSHLGMLFERLTSPAQIHGNLILKVEKQDEGRGRFGRDTAVPYVDGLISDEPGLALILLSADCPLIVVYDPDRPAVGAVHAGWLGTVSRISAGLVEQMQSTFGSDPQRMLAGIAPSAGPCCYEVGKEVYRIGKDRLKNPEECFRRGDGRFFLDLWTANRQQLAAAGIQEENIEVAGLCSICDHRFWTFLRSGGVV